ncbi:MAG TPA: glycosyltransferase, partial [Nocardioidaceae bacterium]|nr:glycosyltransferase [Nocardioidaceae bacterium]
MRVAIVTESFFPQVNGVTNTVRHTVDRLLDTGHEPLIIAPGPGLSRYRTVPVVRVRSVGLPGYKSFMLGLPDASVERALAEFRPDVVHLASPIALGALGLRAARRLGLPTVAIYQTDIAGFARHYGIRADAAVGRWVGRIHRR